MTEYLFTFQSLTQAQNGLRLLQRNAVEASLHRTPKSVASRGCGYSLVVSEPQLRRAADVLRERNVSYRALYRKLANDTLEEVLL